MSGIFISFRGEDSAGHAGRLYDRLAVHFRDRPVLMETKGIEPGVDFVEAIEQTINSSDVVLAVIGREWLTCPDNARNRLLDNPNDFIRLELAFALNNKIRLIPLLVDGAMMPPADSLPDDLKHLSRRHGLELRDSRWDADVKELIAVLEKQLKPAADTETVGGKAKLIATIHSEWIKRRLAIAGSVATLIVIGIAVLLMAPPTWLDRSTVGGAAQGDRSEQRNVDNRQQLADTADTLSASRFAGPLLREADMSLLGHTDHVIALAPLPDGQLASMSSNEMMLWKLDTGESQTIFRNDKNNYEHHMPDAITPLPDGRLAFGHYGGISIWSPKSGRVEITIKVSDWELSTSAIIDFVPLPDGRLASWVSHGPIIIWNLKTKKAETIIRQDAQMHGTGPYAWLPDNRIALGGEYRGSIALWSLKTGKLEASLEEHTKEVTSLAMLPDGRLASASNEGIFKLWDLASDKTKTYGIEDSSSYQTLLAALPDQRLLVARDDVINLWNLATGEIERTFATDDKGWIVKLLLLPNGRFVTTAYSGDHTIKLWNLNSGQLEASLRGHTDDVRALTLLPDGRLASASKDKSIKLWTLPADTLISSAKENP